MTHWVGRAGESGTSGIRVRPDEKIGDRTGLLQRLLGPARRRQGVVLLLALLVLPGCSSGSEPPQGPAKEGWVLVTSDEFDGNRLDTGRWRANRFGGSSADAPFQLDQEAAAYVPDQVEVTGGHLVLTASPLPVEAGGRTWAWSSGTVSGEGGLALRDGDLVEARILVPRAPGLWPAFWAVTSDVWPPEIDGFEFFDAGVQGQPDFNYHRSDGTQSGPSRYGDPTTDYRGEWHVYGYQRTRGRLVPYLDGVAYPVAGADRVDTLDYFPIINLAVRADAGPAATQGGRLEVDWIRVWRPR